ncbi:MAG: hypothetical protein V3U78_03150, partial [Thiotrichaceae bacterium]
PWRELLKVYWRMEARGEIRGGRFVQSVSGEQFALPDAVGSLRKIRNKPDDDTDVVISACDPLNLQGVLLSGDKIPVLAVNKVLYRGGKVIAMLDKQGVHYLAEIDDADKRRVASQLFRG